MTEGKISTTEISGFRRFDFSSFPHKVTIDNDLTISTFNDLDVDVLEAITEGDDEVQRFIPWAKESKSHYIERVNRDRDTRGPRYGVRLGDKLVGHIAIFPSHDTRGVIEIGYLLSQEARGQKIIDRVVPVCEDLVISSNPGARLALCINDDNQASKRVAERLGYVPSDSFSSGDRMYFKARSNNG